jgi:hypothetical protein
VLISTFSVGTGILSKESEERGLPLQRRRNGWMNKEVKTEVKKMKKYANPSSSFDVENNGGHLTVMWNMEDINGEKTSIKCFMSTSPSDWRWKKSHRTALRKIFRENNIGVKVH